MSGSFGGQNRKEDNDGNPDQSMGDDHNGLEPRQGVDQSDIDNALNGSNGEDKESTLPSLRDVGWVVHGNAALDESANQKGTTGRTSLPRESCHPSREVAEEFLVLSWCKFRNPVILATTCWCHTGHFCK
jgi:hypothetical protein